MGLTKESDRNVAAFNLQAATLKRAFSDLLIYQPKKLTDQQFKAIKRVVDQPLTPESAGLGPGIQTLLRPLREHEATDEMTLKFSEADHPELFFDASIGTIEQSRYYIERAQHEAI